VNGIRSLTQKHRTVLFIDDIQWIDEGSAAVLRNLRETFGPGSDAPLVIIVASRDPQAMERLDIEDFILSLTPPSQGEQIRFLENSLGIEKASARRLVNALGVMGQEAGGMFWLIRAVREVVDENAFEATERGFALLGR